MKKLSLLCLTPLFLLFACQKKVDVSTASNNAEVKANWSSTDKWASWSNGGYTIYNLVWGSGAGPQSIWANSYSNWGVWANHPNTNGVKSYPNCTKYVGKTVSSLNSCTSSFNVTVPNSGVWEATYDLWDNNKANEIMLWMNYTGGADGSGPAKPIAASYDASGRAIATKTNVNVGGHTWNVFKGWNGSNNVFSFLRTSKTNSGTVNIKAIYDWLRSQGWIGNVTLGEQQFGFEITSSNGGYNFNCNSFSVSYN